MLDSCTTIYQRKMGSIPGVGMALREEQEKTAKPPIVEWGGNATRIQALNIQNTYNTYIKLGKPYVVREVVVVGRERKRTNGRTSIYYDDKVDDGALTMGFFCFALQAHFRRRYWVRMSVARWQQQQPIRRRMQRKWLHHILGSYYIVVLRPHSYLVFRRFGRFGHFVCWQRVRFTQHHSSALSVLATVATAMATSSWVKICVERHRRGREPPHNIYTFDWNNCMSVCVCVCCSVVITLLLYRFVRESRESEAKQKEREHFVQRSHCRRRRRRRIIAVVRRQFTSNRKYCQDLLLFTSNYYCYC